MAPLAEAAGGASARGDLDFAVGSTNVREVNDVPAAMDAMRTSSPSRSRPAGPRSGGSASRWRRSPTTSRRQLTVLRANADFVAGGAGRQKDADLRPPRAT